MANERLDGRGAPIIDDADYYVQDARSVVGNCASWWAQNRQGYVCNLAEAGVYKGGDVRSMRDTDIAWPVEYIDPLAVRHVRADTQALRRNDRPQRPPLELSRRARARRPVA